MKYMKYVITHFSSKQAFNANELKIFLKNRGVSNSYYKIVIQNLLKSGRIFKITRGSYTFHEEAQYVGYAFKPFYYGLEDALSLRGIWEQETNPVVITPRKVRNGIRQFEGRNYLIRRIERAMFFGFTYIRYGDFYIPVSDIEKIFIDLLYFNVRVPADVFMALKRAIDDAKLKDYTDRCPVYLKNRLAHFIDTEFNVV